MSIYHPKSILETRPPVAGTLQIQSARKETAVSLLQPDLL
jgi:hypothetical protein